MITIDNYFEKTKGIDFSSMNPVFAKSHEYVLKATENGTNMNALESEAIKKAVNTYLEKLNEHLGKQKPIKEEPKSSAIKHEPEKKIHQPAETKKSAAKERKTEPQEDENDFSFVERIPDEIRFIKRLVSWNNKRKIKDDFLRFINSLHRSIIEKKVQKSSPYASQIKYIQDNLVKTYNSMGKSILVKLSDKTLTEMKAIIASEKVMPSVMLIKRYIGLNGKFGVKHRAELLLKAMDRAVKLKKISKKDKYTKVLDQIYYNLHKYVNSKTQKVMDIQRTELNGLQGVLAGCGCQALNDIEEMQGLNGVEETGVGENPAVMNSMDFNKVLFETLGFSGKYLNLIGDPSRGFTAMVFGKPKMGKSYLCVDFAGYLARNHGKVLYIAKEEGLDRTLQDKLKAKEVAHPNLFVTDEIPEDLKPYDFIFLDSVNKLGLSADDLTILEKNNPEKSFIYVFQTNKDGSHKGTNEHKHNVDVVIEVPEKGLAVQNGRFNQGGEMRIFDDKVNPAQAA